MPSLTLGISLIQTGDKLSLAIGSLCKVVLRWPMFTDTVARRTALQKRLPLTDTVARRMALQKRLPLTDTVARRMALQKRRTFSNTEVSEAIHGYLRKYGMQCPGEIDITRPRFNEKPSTLVPLILSNVQNFEAGERVRQINRGLEKYELKKQELLSIIGKNRFAKKKLHRKISLLRNFAGFREYPKYTLICRYWIIKQALMREAEKLAENGVIPHKEDIYFLTIEELRTVMKTGTAELHLIEERKLRHAYNERLTPPRIMTSGGESVSGEYDSENMPEGALPGVAVSSGTAEGIARVAEHLGTASFGPEDILVTKFTDPSWTPAFVSIKGLVTEVGGTMTHGAVIAREYGLPAVVSVENVPECRIMSNLRDSFIALIYLVWYNEDAFLYNTVR